MEPEDKQQEITEEKTSPDISAEETKVSEAKEQDINRIVQSQIDKRLAPIYQERDTAKQEADSYKRDKEDLQRQTEELDAEISRMQDKAYADDPELLKDAKSKRQFVKDQRDMVRREKELKDAQVALGQQAKASDIADIATKYGVSVKVLERADVRDRTELEEFAREIAGESKKEAPVIDRAISDAVPSDFKRLQQNFIDDPMKYGKEYREALAKRGQ